MSGPLSGIRVIEFAALGPTPFACMMLADMGAEVTRIDRIPKASASAMDSLMANDGVVDRGRRSIAIDMKDARGRDAVLKMIQRADVLVEGFRPGVMEKLGLGPQACLDLSPTLIYGRMTGWGQTGPLSLSAAHDLNYVALSGALHAVGPNDRPPPPALNLLGDYGGGGMMMCAGVCAALFERSRSGRGQVIDAAMTDGAAILMATLYGLKAKGFWSATRESNFLDGAAHFYCAYECADGKYVSIGAIEPQFYQALLRLCGISDPDFASQWSAKDWPRLKAKLAAVFRTRPRDAWTALLEGSEACFAPVLDMDEAPGHVHNVARQTFVESAGIVQPAPAPRFSATPSVLPTPAPPIGANGRQVLRDCDFSPSSIDELVASGVLYDNPTGAAA